MNRSHIISHAKHLCGELIISLIVACALFMLAFERQTAQNKFFGLIPISSISRQLNVHDTFYSKNHDMLESRFPFRKRNDPLAYIRQVFIVFGGATLFILILMKMMHPPRSFQEVAGWDVSFLCCAFNLTFSYVFGFVAVIYDWWFFFPDLITGKIWQIGHGQMVLGDVLFYPMAIIMGHAGVLLVCRMKKPVRYPGFDNFLKIAWFTIAAAVIFGGIIFGSTVMKVMIFFLYIPYGIAGLFIYRRYTGLELWSVTCLFVICEFLWDLVARIRGIWIFPDASTHPGLYFKEIVFFNIGGYPVVWQPEMTQMAFMSGVICFVFFHLSRYVLGKKSIV